MIKSHISDFLLVIIMVKIKIETQNHMALIEIKKVSMPSNGMCTLNDLNIYYLILLLLLLLLSLLLLLTYY